jgi:hypothetical protein
MVFNVNLFQVSIGVVDDCFTDIAGACDRHFQTVTRALGLGDSEVWVIVRSG